jgi:hypothetical protein
MRAKRKAAFPEMVGTLEKTASNNCLNNNQLTAKKQCLKFNHSNYFRPFIKAIIGILFDQNLIGFCTACKLSRLMRCEHD